MKDIKIVKKIDFQANRITLMLNKEFTDLLKNRILKSERGINLAFNNAGISITKIITQEKQTEYEICFYEKNPQILDFNPNLAYNGCRAFNCHAFIKFNKILDEIIEKYGVEFK